MQIKNHYINRNFENYNIQAILFVGLLSVLLTFFFAYIMNWFGFAIWFDSIESLSSLFEVISAQTYLPFIIILLPVVGGIGQFIIGRNVCVVRDTWIITTTFLTIVFIILMFPMASEEGLAITIPNLLGFGLTFMVDMVGFTMLLITSVLWFLVMLYSHEYMKHEQHCNRFLFFMALTYSAVLGTVMSGDLLTMFLFFEIMTFASYVLVTHGQKEESYSAGYNYIFMGLIGGFAILAAMILLFVHVGDVRFQSAIAQLSQLGSVRYWIIGLLVFGFGIKAGMAPVHVWLPRAHPVAPTPASALLSGIMIKVGAFGIIRVATSYFFPETFVTGTIWNTMENIGFVIIWLGIITMAVGVFLALQQSNIKRMLAYHSISQMGYIVLGIGVALYLGYKGAMGYTGAMYHIINHALFKSLLFMVAGVVYLRTRESDMYKLGGLWKKLPITAGICLVAALGISGIPLFNGFISKSILHHGIVEAYEYGHRSFYYAEWIFNIISAGTVCSFIKLFSYTFLGKLPDKYKDMKPEFMSLHIPMLVIAVMIVLIGLNPRFILDGFIVPALSKTAYDPGFIVNYVVGLKFFTGEDIMTMFFVVILGFIIFYAGKRYHLFHLKLPSWLRFEYMFFYPINRVMRLACRFMYGDRCPINKLTMAKIELNAMDDVGFLERFTLTAGVFNRRYENIIIKSDALIYTLFLTGILIYLLLKIPF